MKLSSIRIKNYRALEDITITLNKNMNVIYGENGVGKSSIVYLLHDSLNTIQHNEGEKFPVFVEKRIRNMAEKASIDIKGDKGSRLEICRFPGSEKEEITKSDDFRMKVVSFIPGMVTSYVVQKIENGQISFGMSIQPKFVYIRGIPNYQKLRDDFFNLEFEENKKRVREYEENKKMEYCNPALQKIRTAIKEINSGFGRITIEGENENRKLIVEKNGIFLDVEDQLSSGEASVIAMIGEICINSFSETTEKDIIVLIDEVDASLHPQWQMKIGKILKTAFPDIQFVMTSHSPFIWSGLDKDEVIWLDYNDEGKVIQKEVEYAKGGSVESIVAHFFDTDNYDNDFSQELNKIEDIIAKKDNTKATEALSLLKTKYGNLPVISQLEFKMRMLGL